MAPIIYLILQLFLRLRLVSSVGISLTAPINPVEEGNMLSIHCQVQQLKISEHVVEMSRNVTGLNDRVSLDTKMMVDDDDERFFLAQRRLQDNSMVYFLSIIEITRDTDEGVYHCIIREKDSLAEIKRESVTVSFKYFPTDIYPICYPSDYDSGEITMTAGQKMTINCTSELGNPDIEIVWLKNDDPLESTKSTENGHSTLQLTFTTSMDDDGAIYVCRITSVAFPDELRNCHVGPFKILPDPNDAKKPPSADTGNTNNKVEHTPREITVAPKVGKSSNNKNGPTYITTECSEVCDENILYWIIATIIAGTLAIVFCIVGIIIFVRYRRRRKEEHKKRENSRNSHYQNREAIYAEVDTRPPEGGTPGGSGGGDNNDNKLYMALDKSSYISTIDTSRASAGASSVPVSPETEPLNSPATTTTPQSLEDPYSTRNVTHTTFGL